MNFKFNFFIILVISCFFSRMFPLAKDTQILTKEGLVLIQNLEKGQQVVGCDLKSNTYSSINVKDIITYEQEDSLIITTDKGIINCSQDQLFYDYNLKKFIKAESCNSNTCFVSYDKQLCKCLNIQRKKELTFFYNISLEKPYTFFSSANCILTHNLNIGVSLTQWTLGLIIAAVYFAQAPKIFDNFESAKKIMIQEQINFVKKFVRNSNNTHNCRNTNVYNSPIIAGINTDLNIYRNIVKMPFLYGPMCCTAQMQEDGQIQANLHIFHFAKNIKDTRCYDWSNLGSATFRRDNPLVKYFIEQEDNQKFKEIYNFVFSLPRNVLNQLFKLNMDVLQETNWLRAKHPNCVFEKQIYDSIFNIHALCHMYNKRISPSLVKYVIKHGGCMHAANPNRLIYYHQYYDVVVIVEKCCNKIANVGRYNDINHLNAEIQEVKTEEKKEVKKEEKKKEEKIIKTVEDILKDAKPGEKTKGKSKQYEKPGNYEDAIKDFEHLSPSKIRDIDKAKNDGKVGDLHDGRSVNVRKGSEDGRPTLEIYNTKNRKKIKIRYGCK